MGAGAAWTVPLRAAGGRGGRRAGWLSAGWGCIGGLSMFAAGSQIGAEGYG